MKRRKQRRVVGLGAFVTISAVLVAIISAMLLFLTIKQNEIVQVNQTLQIEQQKSMDLQSELEGIQKQRETMNQQVEELKEEIEKLQLKSGKKSEANIKNKEKVAYLTLCRSEERL